MRIQNSNKSADFSVGFATEKFAGIKIVGGNQESVGLCGNGKICGLVRDAANLDLDVNPDGPGDFEFKTGMVFGVAYVFASHKLLFSLNG